MALRAKALGAAALLLLALLAAAADADEVVDAVPRAPSVAERIAEIRRRVQAAVVYPEVARRHGWTGTTRVEFEIDGRGLATDVAVVETSGHSLLDRAATRGVRDAGVLPRVYGRLRIPVRFALE